MKEKLDQIRSLIDEIEGESAEEVATVSAFSGLELPDIMRDVVDLLMPELRPFEAAIYLYLLRHSIIETGSQHIRASTRRLQSGVVKSAYAGSTSGGKDADSAAASFKTVGLALKALVATGAIREEGDPNREGTLFRIMLPEEIEVCRKRREEILAHSSPIAATESDADFYNVRENRVKVYERDEYKCQYCDKQLTRFTATLDHVRSVKNGGDNGFENLLTACLRCNSKKNALPLGDFLADTRE
jgi:hypothetical protein